MPGWSFALVRSRMAKSVIGKCSMGMRPNRIARSYWLRPPEIVVSFTHGLFAAVGADDGRVTAQAVKCAASLVRAAAGKIPSWRGEKVNLRDVISTELFALRNRERRFGQNCSRFQVVMCGSSCRTTFNNELWTSSLPL